MISSASEMRRQGASDLRGRWGEAALFTFVYFIIAAIFSSTVTAGTDLFVSGLGSVLSIFLIPMGWGYSMTFLANHRHEDDDPFNIGHLFDGYRDFVRIFLTLLLQKIYIALWAAHCARHHQGLLLCHDTIHPSRPSGPQVQRSHRTQHGYDARTQGRPLLALPVLHRMVPALHPDPRYRLLLAGALHDEQHGKLLRRGESRI